MENMAEAFWTDFLDLYFADSTGRLPLGLICPVTDSTHRSQFIPFTEMYYDYSFLSPLTHLDSPSIIFVLHLSFSFPSTPQPPPLSSLPPSFLCTLSRFTGSTPPFQFGFPAALLSGEGIGTSAISVIEGPRGVCVCV